MSLRENNMPRPDPFWVKLLPAKIRVRMEGRDNLFAVLHNSGWLVADKVFRALAAIVVSAWVARYLGPADFGKLSFILAIVAFFQVVSVLGLDGIVVRDIVKNKEEAGLILGTALAMRLLAGAFSWIGIVLAMMIIYGPGNDNMWMALFIGGSLIFQAADTVDLWFQSQTQSRRTVLVKFLAVLLSGLLRIFLIVQGASLIYFAAAFFLEFAIQALALAFSYRRFPCGRQWKAQIKTTGKELLKESWPFLLSSVSILVYMRLDQGMIKEMLSEKELGIYSAVTLFSIGWYFIPAVIYTSLLPMMTKVKQQNEELYLSRLAKIFRINWILATILCALVYWQGKNLILIIYGRNYLDGEGVLSVHIFTNIPGFLRMSSGIWVIIEKKSGQLLAKAAIGGVVSLTANLLLIPRYGLLGAAITSVLAQLGACLAGNYFIDKKLFYLQLGISQSSR